MKFANNCHYCSRPMEGTNHCDKQTRDHKIPLSRGGPDNSENVVLCCNQCNQEKSNMTDAEFIEWRRRGRPNRHAYLVEIGLIPKPNAETRPVEIVGVVTLGHSNKIPGHENEEKRCICCPDFPSHIYTTRLELPEYEPNTYPEHFGRNLDQWVQSNFAFKKHEGRKIKITAELLP